jgi:hypothetical protein
VKSPSEALSSETLDDVAIRDRIGEGAEELLASGEVPSSEPPVRAERRGRRIPRFS